MKVFYYRLYPTKAQKKNLNQTLELCRWTYNQTLALRKNAWEKWKMSPRAGGQFFSSVTTWGPYRVYVRGPYG